MFCPNNFKSAGIVLWEIFEEIFVPGWDEIASFKSAKLYVSSQSGTKICSKVSHKDDLCAFKMVGMKHAFWAKFREDLCN